MFDAVQFQGISLASSDAMLPDLAERFCPDHPRDCQNQRPGHGSAKWLRAVSNLRHPRRVRD
ncbi:hypothetical protein LN650_16445 [Klebsiella pneumoniae subsp. pneumoniae]|nr:hypothetical protein [Klebsiella pneumoniae subsp. pneumoniae]